MNEFIQYLRGFADQIEAAVNNPFMVERTVVELGLMTLPHMVEDTLGPEAVRHLTTGLERQAEAS